jgi:tetratricopeptide (TPR) repeat protein
MKPLLARGLATLLLLLLSTSGSGAVSALGADGNRKTKTTAAEGAAAPDISQKAFDAALALREAGQYPEAEQAFRALAAARTQALGAEARETLLARTVLVKMELDREAAAAGAEGAALLQSLQRVLGAEDRTTLNFQRWLIYAKIDQGNYTEAEQDCRRLIPIATRALGAEDDETLEARMTLADVFIYQRKLEDGVKEMRQLLNIYARVDAGKHEEAALNARHNLAQALLLQKNYEEAETLLRGVVAAEMRLHGPEHPRTLSSRNILAWVLIMEEKQAEAEKELRSVIAIQARTLGPEHPDTLRSRANLAGELPTPQAVQEFRAVLALRERVLGPENPETLSCCVKLAWQLVRQNKRQEAMTYAQRAYAGQLKILGREHPDTQESERLVNWLTKPEAKA